VKPNVAVQGQDAAIFFSGNYAATADGTSFAAPTLAGAAACLWQAFDTLSNMEIFHAIESSASQFTSPDTLLGYGIPNFMSAFTLLHTTSVSLPAAEGIVNVYPVPFQGEFTVVYNSYSTGPVQLKLMDVLGKVVLSETPDLNRGLQAIHLPASSLSKGIYFLDMVAGEKRFTKSLLKN